MTQQQLKDVMVFQLSSLNMTGNVVNYDTVFNAILSTNSTLPGLPSSADLFRGFIRYSLLHGGHNDKTWPANWLSLTPNTLSPQIL